MTRISLKEQYDNSSVVKQISDLTTEIESYEEQIAEATETATAAKTTADAAKVTADSAAAKNTEQDSRLDSIESVNTTQEQEIAGMKLKDAQQDASIDELSQEQDEQDAKIAAIQSKDSEQDAKIAAIQAKDAEQDLSISSILDTDTKQDTAIDALKTMTNTLTNEVISAVNVTDGTQNGSIMVRLTDTGGAVISSPSYPWGQVATFALKQGSEAGYVRGVLTLSDGEVIESNDYQILQIQESDVYVTSITLTPYPTTGKMGGEIGYSNGNVAQINVIDVPTAPGVTTNINDLLSRMGVVESGVNDLDVRVKAIEDTPGVEAFTNLSRGTILGSAEDGKVSANVDGTGSVSGWSDVVKSSQISDMLTKTDAASTYLTKTDAAAAYETLEGAEQISVVANEAKSTAEDAQSKANGCIDGVSVSGSTMTFTKVDDTQIDVPIPSIPSMEVHSLKVSDTIKAKKLSLLSASSNTLLEKFVGYNNYWISTKLVSVGCHADDVFQSSAKFFVTLAPASHYVILAGGNVYSTEFLTTELDAQFHDYLASLGLPDGNYSVIFKPVIGCLSSELYSTPKVDYAVESGNVTLTDTSTTKTYWNSYANMELQFFISDITKNS